MARFISRIWGAVGGGITVGDMFATCKDCKHHDEIVEDHMEIYELEDLIRYLEKEHDRREYEKQLMEALENLAGERKFLAGFVLCTHSNFGPWLTHRREGWENVGCADKSKDCLFCLHHQKLEAVEGTTAEGATGICRKKLKLTDADNILGEECPDFEDADGGFEID